MVITITKHRDASGMTWECTWTETPVKVDTEINRKTVEATNFYPEPDHAPGWETKSCETCGHSHVDDKKAVHS